MMKSSMELFDLQCQAIRDCYPDLVEKLDAENVTKYLFTQSVFKVDDLDEINSQTITSQRNIRLLSKVAYRDGGWKHLLLALEEGRQKFLKDKLVQRFQELLSQFNLSNSLPGSPNDSAVAFNIPPMPPALMMLSTPENITRRHRNQNFIRTNVWEKLSSPLWASSQSQVYVMKSKQSGFECAMKTVRLIDSKLLIRAHEPHEILMLLEHPNIVQYYDYSIDSHKIRVRIFMERLEVY